MCSSALACPRPLRNSGSCLLTSTAGLSVAAARFPLLLLLFSVWAGAGGPPTVVSPPEEPRPRVRSSRVRPRGPPAGWTHSSPLFAAAPGGAEEKPSARCEPASDSHGNPGEAVSVDASCGGRGGGGPPKPPSWTVSILWPEASGSLRLSQTHRQRPADPLPLHAQPGPLSPRPSLSGWPSSAGLRSGRGPRPPCAAQGQPGRSAGPGPTPTAAGHGAAAQGTRLKMTR